ncbi:MAG: acyltransferase [Bacteroidales bacterium]|nr:acyltransferase [Bacteroidales bacterium]
MQTKVVASQNFADTKPHYELLDGLRGVAAIMVLIYHIFEGFAFAEGVNGAGDGIIRTLNHGHIAVDFFFILSGFVISYAYDDRWNKMTLGGFFKRRLIRLHPMIVMGAIIGVVAFACEGFKTWTGETTPIGWVMLAMLLTMFMIPAVPGASYEVRGNGEMFPLNGPSWSLFFEYIGNILYALIIRRLSTKLLTLLVVVLGVLHAWFYVFDISQYNCVGVGWTIDTINFWGGLLRMLFPFTVGMLLARTFRPRKIRGAFWICSILLIVIFALPFIELKPELVSLNALYEVLCIAFIFPFIVWIGACGGATDNYTSKINKFLGDISYPLYIVHYPIMYVFYKWLIKQEYYSLEQTWLIPLVVVLSSIVLAYAVLKLYDEPVRRWLSSKLMKK